MISLAAQKFVSDIANDALQHCKMRGSGQSSRKSGKVYMIFGSLKYDLCPQKLHSFWSAPRSATSGKVQYWKSPIHGHLVTLSMLRVKSDNLIG